MDTSTNETPIGAQVLPDFRGFVAPLPTAFNLDGSLDLKLVSRLAEHYVSKGVGGFFVLGSGGQGPTIDVDGRKAVCTEVVGAVAGAVPVIIHVGTADPYTTSELAEHAKEAGADGIAIVGPYYYQHNAEELLEHFSIVDSRTDLPIVLYNNPETQGYRIPISTVKRLVHEVPNVFASKVAKGTVDDAASFLNEIPGFGVFNLISYVVPAMFMGARGSISPPMLDVPELGVALVAAIDSRDFQEAVRLQTLTVQFVEASHRLARQYDHTAVREHSLRMQGIPVERLRRWATPSVPPECITELQEVRNMVLANL